MPPYKRITFMAPYSLGIAPSQRFRFEQYFCVLKERGFHVNYLGFIARKNSGLFTHRNSLSTLSVICLGILRRIIHLGLLSQSDFVFIHRELSPVGPPFFEWIIAKVFKKKIIYDFDDAIWATDKANESKLSKLIRWRGKVASICRWSYRISCGNEYLAAYARQFNSNVIVNPTTIDTAHLHNPTLYLQSKNYKEKITIGWTGSHSTLKYLNEVEPAINYLQQKYHSLYLLVIADRKPELRIDRMEFIPWNKKTEAADLLRIDIGIMPLPDDDWSRGKCGFKALQYMAMQIPCVASPVGVNVKIIEHGQNGYLTQTYDEWVTCLENLIVSDSLRKKFGEAGRKKIISHYSVESNASTFLSLFE